MTDAASTWSERYWDDYPPSCYLAEKVDGIVVFGESQVGKTCFLDQILKARPNNLYHDNRHLMWIDGEMMNGDFMDLSSTTMRTAGPTFSPFLFTEKLSRAVGVVLIYDITSLKSFEHITNDAYMALSMCKRYMGDEIGGKSCECILVGNKADLLRKAPHKREVSKDLAEQWAQSQGMIHFELTAHEHVPVREAVEDLMRAVRRVKQRSPEVEKKKEAEAVEKKPLRARFCDTLGIRQGSRIRLTLDSL